MKAVMIREHGATDVLRVETDVPMPELRPGSVLIRNEYSGLNFIDTYYRTGLYKQELPFISGQEGGGVVHAIHDDDKDSSPFQVGDRVVYMAFGSLAEYTAVPISKVVKLPQGISMEIAVACMVQGLTAHYLVTDATAGLIAKDEWCLIYSVGSGTCQWAAQMAKLQGYKVIGTTSKGKQETAPSCCDELIVLDPVEGKSYSDYNSVDIQKKVMEITNNSGVELIVDGVGKATADISIGCLARRGIWISFGNASGAVPPVSLLKFTPKSAFCTRPKLGDYVATQEELEQRCNDVFGWVSSNKLNVKVDQIFSIDEAAQGQKYLESGNSKGKILFKIS
jgi:NADPH:quinone reductase